MSICMFFNNDFELFHLSRFFYEQVVGWDNRIGFDKKYRAG